MCDTIMTIFKTLTATYPGGDTSHKIQNIQNILNIQYCRKKKIKQLLQSKVAGIQYDLPLTLEQ